eukprot:CAMPEP_0184855450 /NCGR_PEP_ID=MMETSP0580-20130426/698_1 /TAXON_ID=1118495 /ORGANISM="Dactyliosolen fragilissimus" /LENGTH=374 /DNA_ID=CAMNT_0027349963 /DNA_START=10 /DNA_END=1131 /DNA_ORIENTATION=-
MTTVPTPTSVPTSTPTPAPTPAPTAEEAGYKTTKDAVILVTGSSGLVGGRLVEMLLERGAKKVLCFDIATPSQSLLDRFSKAAKGDESKYVIFSGNQEGNLVNPFSVNAAFDSENQIDVVYHIAALVGPYHERSKYMSVNYDGTLHVLDACKIKRVPRFVYSSSPSTRFHGSDIEGLTEDELTFPEHYLALYAESKALAEMVVSKTCCPDLMTVSVAPHQVYGPHDPLFLPGLLEAAGHNKLRIFGKGLNKVSLCYVDNYCHGLMCGADALYPNSPALAKFYIVTDGPPQLLWNVINQAVIAMGFTDLYSKFHLNTNFLYFIAYICNLVGFCFRKKFKLNPFSVRMLTIHRYFSIQNATKDLQYQPLFQFENSW